MDLKHLSSAWISNIHAYLNFCTLTYKVFLGFLKLKNRIQH